MAKVILSPMLTSLRGAAGTCMFTRSPRGTVLRKNVPIPFRRTDAQIKVRDTWAQLWVVRQALFSSVRDAQVRFVAFKPLTPWGWFVQKNLTDELVNQGRTLTPADPTVGSIREVAFTQLPPNILRITWNPDGYTPNQYITVWARNVSPVFSGPPYVIYTTDTILASVGFWERTLPPAFLITNVIAVHDTESNRWGASAGESTQS